MNNPQLKRIIQENINEANIRALGLCYPFAMEMARKWYDDHVTEDDSGKRPKVIVHPDRDNLDKFKVVHGTITDTWKDPPKATLHGWVEMGDTIFDSQTQHTKPNGIDRATYYEFYQPEPKNEYTAKQAIAKCYTKGTKGPWDAKSMAKMKARDEWLGENKVNRTQLKKIIKEECEKLYEVEYDKHGPMYAKPDPSGAPTPNDAEVLVQGYGGLRIDQIKNKLSLMLRDATADVSGGSYRKFDAIIDSGVAKALLNTLRLHNTIEDSE